MSNIPAKLIIRKPPKPKASAVQIQPSLQEIQPRRVIYFDAEELQKNEKDEKRPQVCRICKKEQREEEKLIIPCKCSQLSKYVHEDCLVEKLVQRVQAQHMEGNAINTVKCETCGQALKFKIQLNHRLSCNAFLKNIQRKGCQFIIVLILLILVGLCVALPSIIASFTGREDFPLYIGNEPGRIGLLVAFCILAVLEMAMLVVFIRQNVAYLEIVIEKVFNFYDQMENFTMGRESSVDDNLVYPLEYFVVMKG